ncbi:hypothetical protein BH11PAT2_BH11PAT2_04750 [soil metagenome]
MEIPPEVTQFLEENGNHYSTITADMPDGTTSVILFPSDPGGENAGEITEVIEDVGRRVFGTNVPFLD